MSSLQKTLESLQPYVIGIRYLDGVPVVDAVFKDGWSIPESDLVKKAKGNDDLNYYMIFSEKEGVGLDDLLTYVDTTIKLNLEREKKHDLLREKVNELKELFKKNSLVRLKRLKFIIGDEELVPDLNDFDIELDENPKPIIESKKVIETEVIEPQPQVTQFLDEDGNAIPLTEEEQEMAAEDARAARFAKLNETKRDKGVVRPINTKKVELPPKRKIEMAISETDYESECGCGPLEACDKCIENKDL